MAAEPEDELPLRPVSSSSSSPYAPAASALTAAISPGQSCDVVDMSSDDKMEAVQEGSMRGNILKSSGVVKVAWRRFLNQPKHSAL